MPTVDTLTRRRLLVLAGRSAAALAAARVLGIAWDDRAFAAAAGRGTAPALLERNAWPPHLETTPAALDAGLDTANDAFFVRCHLAPPALDPTTWRLEVTGLVDRPLTLSLADLARMPRTERRVTLECAGNGRGLMPLANTSGTQWGAGAVGTARWEGVALAAILARAGVKAAANHAWFEAADHATLPQAPLFLRSLPLALASDRSLLATHMNGAALPALHGGPARVVTPGWYGMASTKWVTRIRLEALPSDNHFMIKGYRYVAAGGDPLASPPVEAMRVKSVVTSPVAGRAGRAGAPLAVRGFAWTGAGDGRVRAVELTVDDGATWTRALLEGEATPFAWQRFRGTVRVPRTATFTLAARATDSTGDAQPATAAKNTGGYGNNGWARVALRPLVGLVLACALAWAAAGSAAPQRVTHLYPATLPKGDGRALATTACLVCHTAQLVNQQAKDSTAWEKTVTQMEKWGAPVPPAQHSLLVRYLVRARGPRHP
jgi:sulfite oxidase